MSQILLNNNFSSTYTDFALPVVTLKTFVKKTTKPESLRYLKPEDIPNYKELINARSLKFISNKNFTKKIKLPRMNLSPIKIRTRTEDLNKAIELQLRVSLKKKPKSRVIKTHKKSQEPDENRLKYTKGVALEQISDEIEPEKANFSESTPELVKISSVIVELKPKPQLNKKIRKKISLLPDSQPLQPLKRIATLNSTSNFRLIQEEML